MATGVALLGIALSAKGQLDSDAAQAKANKENAAFFQVQKEQAEAAARRAADIFEKESDIFFGDQVSSFVKAGVDISGSSLLVLAGTKGDIRRESSAIIRDGKITSQLAGMRADQASKNADFLSSSGRKGLIVGGAAAQAFARTQKPSTTTTTTQTNRNPLLIAGTSSGGG